MRKFKKIDPIFKEKWLAALRGESGLEYVQTDGELAKAPGWFQRDPETGKEFRIVKSWGFCCLGVGCDILTRDGTLINGYPLEFDYNVKQWHYPGLGDWDDPSTVWLDGGEWDGAVLDAVGLDENAQVELIAMNDAGTSFEEIADWIEAHL